MKPYFDEEGHLIINNPQWVKAEPRTKIRKQTLLTEAHRLHMGESSWVITIRPSSKSLDRDERQLRNEGHTKFSEYDLVEPNFYIVYVRAKTLTTAKKLAWDRVRNMPMGVGIRKQDVHISARPANDNEIAMERVHILDHNSSKYREYLYRGV